VEANFKDGVLEISFHLKEAAKQKKIEVKES
jgi:HSP20 family molecular chaperone IbpA